MLLDFGCGSMEISKKLEKKSFVKKIIGTDVFNFKFKTKKMQYMQSAKVFKKNSRYKFDIVSAIDVLHHIGVIDSQKILIKLSKSS